jgi:hypothetical protein
MEHLMGLYEEGIEELMDAQKYANKSMKANNEEEKIMYKNLARQELEHAQMIIKDGDRMSEKAGVHEMAKVAWKHLRDHLLEWHADLHRKVI